MLRKYLIESLLQYTDAHETARKNAMMPIESGGLGLPKDNTAKDRAKAMGFDVETKWLHGTSKSGYVGSTDIKNFQLDKVGSKFNQDKSGFFFTNRNDEANYYASSDLDYYNKGAGHGAVYPVHLKYGNSKSIKSPTDENITHWDKNASKFNELLANSDLDSIVMNDKSNYKMSIVNKPHHIRSIHAAFDPLRQHESDLLA